MKVLMYVTDKGGLKNYSEYLVSAMIKQGRDVTISDKLDYKNFDIVHIQFEHTLFHPFGLKLIPKLMKLKLKKKKIVITNHTILTRKEIYSRNKLFTFIKKFLFPLDEILMGFLSDKIIVHTHHAKKVLINTYETPKSKIEVIALGVY